MHGKRDCLKSEHVFKVPELLQRKMETNVKLLSIHFHSLRVITKKLKTESLRVHRTARSNQSILKEINPKYSLEWLMLKLQYVGHLMLTHWKRLWCWERLRAEGEGGDRGWDGWMASSTQRIWVWVSSGSWWWTGKPGVLQSMGSQRVRHN